MNYRCSCLVLPLGLLLPGTALANSWNVPGDSLSVFMNTPDYKQAVCPAEDYKRGELTLHRVISEHIIG